MESDKDAIGLVSLGVIARNEEKNLPSLLDDILRQTYDRRKIELVFVDGMSSDSTRRIMEQFAAEHKSDYYDILVLDNEKVIQPCGWNVVILSSLGDVVIRVDAHARLSQDFIANNVKVLDEGESVCVCFRQTIIQDPTPLQEVIHMAVESSFGSSVASYRRSGERRYVKSVFHGAYRRGVFDKAGLFDERLMRTEDNELHFRIRENGFKICFDPSIRSAQLARPTLRKMLKQKYMNGYWIGKTLYVSPRCFQLYHFVPLAFVLILMAAAICALSVSWFPLVALVLAYFLLDGVLSVVAVASAQHRSFLDLFLPLLFPLIHIVYGVGTLFGIVSGPLWLRRLRLEGAADVAKGIPS